MKGPSQIELMAFADGELDPARAREVQAWLAAHPEDAALVRSMNTLGDLVRTAASQKPAPSIDLSASIMQRVEAPVTAVRPPARVRRLPWVGTGIAAVFAAAAAILLSVTMKHNTAALLPIAHSIATSLPPNAGAASISVTGGAAIEAVDFGASMGSIFYVPGDDNTPTPVVWIQDEELSP